MNTNHSLGPITAPQFAEGKLTYAGIMIAALAWIARQFGGQFPEAEATSIADWLSLNWETLAQGAGLLIAFYGRLRINWRE